MSYTPPLTRSRKNVSLGETAKLGRPDDPWITDEIRRLIRSRRRKYDRHHRSGAWKEIKRLTDEKIKESKEEFYQKSVDKMKESGSSQLPYRLLKELAIPDRPPVWSVNSLRPGKSDQDLAEELASFFVRTTDEFEPLGADSLPSSTHPSPYELLLPHQIAERIRAEKKSKSAVAGDILPKLANKYSDLLAIPATRIINHALTLNQWPDRWLIETQSAIPKTDNAASFDQLRNISCTNALFKILESFVLEKLTDEVKLAANQYGGLRGVVPRTFLYSAGNESSKPLNLLKRPSPSSQ